MTKAEFVTDFLADVHEKVRTMIRTGDRPVDDVLDVLGVSALVLMAKLDRRALTLREVATIAALYDRDAVMLFSLPTVQRG